MDHTQDIARDVVLPQKPVSTHRLLVGGTTALGDAVSVVHLLWSVQAKPHGKAFLGKKAAPVLIEERTIGLYPVGDTLV